MKYEDMKRRLLESMKRRGLAGTIDDWLEQQELKSELDINHNRFERLWRKAHREGEKVMHATKESPAWCFAWVRIPDGLFAFWLVKTGKARYSGGVRVSISFKDIHDCDRLDAYAGAFARVLRAAGIDAYDESRMD